jgi:hypothetical protein
MPAWSGDFDAFAWTKVAPIPCLQLAISTGKGGAHLAPGALSHFDMLVERGTPTKPEGILVVAAYQFDTQPLAMELVRLRPKLPVFERFRYGNS